MTFWGRNVQCQRQHKARIWKLFNKVCLGFVILDSYIPDGHQSHVCPLPRSIIKHQSKNSSQTNILGRGKFMPNSETSGIGKSRVLD